MQQKGQEGIILLSRLRLDLWSTLLCFFIFKLVIGKTTVKIVKVSKSVIFSKTKWCKKTFKLWKQFTIEAIFKK